MSQSGEPLGITAAERLRVGSGRRRVRHLRTDSALVDGASPARTPGVMKSLGRACEHGPGTFVRSSVASPGRETTTVESGASQPWIRWPHASSPRESGFGTPSPLSTVS